jgi:hypothetical protein
MLYLINENARVICYFSREQFVRSLAFSFRMDHYTVRKTDHDRFLDIAVKFRERWNFPNFIGCIDGKHIRIKCPTKAGSLFCNYNPPPPWYYKVLEVLKADLFL